MDASIIISLLALVASGFGLWHTVTAGRKAKQLEYEASRRLLVTQLWGFLPRIEDALHVMRGAEEAIAKVSDLPDFSDSSLVPYFAGLSLEFSELIRTVQSSNSLKHMEIETKLTKLAAANEQLLYIEDRIRTFENVIELGKQLSKLSTDEAFNKSLIQDTGEADAG